jgi:hypothetical protein
MKQGATEGAMAWSEPAVRASPMPVHPAERGGAHKAGLRWGRRAEYERSRGNFSRIP